MLCHFLIGVPGAGKSTFAQKLAKLEHSQIIATDAIRKQLYGDEAIQGNWCEVEAEVLHQINISISQNIPVIYDATNAKRAWRIDLLQKLDSFQPRLKSNNHNVDKVMWIGWYFKTDLAICKQWNQARNRQVPDIILEQMAENLTNFPPIVDEGFKQIIEVDNKDLATDNIHHFLLPFS
jgi:predicted kinase